MFNKGSLFIQMKLREDILKQNKNVVLSPSRYLTDKQGWPTTSIASYVVASSKK